jgi:hypothetical protein
MTCAVAEVALPAIDIASTKTAARIVIEAFKLSVMTPPLLALASNSRSPGDLSLSRAPRIVP